MTPTSLQIFTVGTDFPKPPTTDKTVDAVYKTTESLPLLGATPTPTPAPEVVATPAPTAAPAGECGFGVVTCAAPAATPAAEVKSETVPQLPTPTSLDDLAAQTSAGAREVLKDTYGSWLDTPSLSAGADNGLGLQAMMLGLAAAGLMMVTIWQAIRLMVTRRGVVLAELVRGLIVASVVTATGILLIDSALLAGDQLSGSILRRGFNDADALVARMGDVLLGTATAERPPVLVMVFALMVLLLGIAQAVFLVLRQVAIPLLGALLPIAAVGQAGPRYTQSWLTKLLALVLAICAYKPLVVLVLCLGFAGPKPTEYSAMDATRGLVSLLVAVALFPVLVRLFAPAARTVVERGMELPARAGRSVPAGSGTPGEVSAVSHATWMATQAPAAAAPASEPASRAHTAPPPVPGQATGVAAAAHGPVSVPPVVVVHGAMGSGVDWPARKLAGDDALIGQMARGDKR
ncbi:MAG: hypothetical protein ACT4QG_01525 [Sporichthyaceae bacterium]